MRVSIVFFSAFLMLLVQGQAFAGGDMLSVSESVILPEKASKVWSVVGAFGGLDRWHPAVRSTELCGSGTSNGDMRVLTLQDGAEITEELLSHNDRGMYYSYSIESSPLPVSGYVSTISVRQDMDGRSFVTWGSTFNAAGASDDDAEKAIRGVYQAGLQSLQQRFP